MIPNILLVEDDHLDIIHANRVLSQVKLIHNLHVAKNGEEALKMLGIGAGSEEAIYPLPEIILLDLNMPRMNGLEFLSIMRADERLKNIKVFVISTSGDEIDKELARELGVSGYIEKPFRLNSTTSKDSFNLHIDLINLKSA
ncbi:MAG TPA: response regulator [Cytophagales bacterium]|nr:response regulator [Cytophagales bacterium]